MDAHLFRRFCDALLPRLEGALIAKSSPRLLAIFPLPGSAMAAKSKFTCAMSAKSLSSL